MPHPIVAEIPRMRRYARALTGNAADADDLVQDTLERAYAKWHTWRRGAEARPWLFAIMHNLFVDRAKLRRSHLVVAPLEDAGEVEVRGGQDAATARLDVAAALARLSPAHREVLLLVALEELSYADAARVLDVPLGTVMSRLAAARARLRELAGDAPGARKVTP
ncbi:MAG TPA: sigma-70 family RNA polymerase sigma factor [Anaeromyxobacter sp.]|nr:sigma-70 family RNA polymerase sigma factor [Anaeromyxobacter sp.]